MAEASWHEWTIELSEFSQAGVDLTNVAVLRIGVGRNMAAQPGGIGTLYIDDIRLNP